MYAIEVVKLYKSYGTQSVLHGVNLQVAPGEVYGLLGPNGTGKSTLIHLLLGFLKPNSGTVTVLGETDLDFARGRIGYLPERMRYHTRFTAREYLRVLGQLSDMHGLDLHDRVEQELERVGLQDAADRYLGTFSKGMLQRIGLAQALLANPEMLLIDEPSSGLDPAGQRELLELLANIRNQGHTIFLCTHRLNEAEYLCDRVGIMAGGRLVTEVDIHNLQGRPGSINISVDEISVELSEQLQDLSPAVECNPRSIVLRPNDEQLQKQVLQHLIEAGVTIFSITPLERPLEQIYMRAVEQAATPQKLPIEPASQESLETIFPQPATPPQQSEHRRGEGDTLLNELLRRSGLNASTSGRPDNRPPHQPASPETGTDAASDGSPPAPAEPPTEPDKQAAEEQGKSDEERS
jgi:ABC-2 type transport system ATP-binding protein